LDYSKKSVDEIAEVFSSWSDDEFFSYLRHDSLHFVLHIERSAELLEELLNDPQIDRALALELVELIKNSSSTLRKMMDALMEYNEAKKTSKSD
jgi:hypothetical protein